MSPSVHLHLIEKSFAKWEDLVAKSGIVKAISFWKRSRLHFTRHLSGCPLLEVDGVAINHHGLPKGMGLNSTSDLDPREVRTILTLLTISRGYTLPITFDPSPITDKGEGALPPFEGREFPHIIRQLGIKKWNGRGGDYHYSTKSGPNGQALATAKGDLQCLPDSLKEDLVFLGGRYMRDAIKSLQENDNFLIKVGYKVFPFSKDPTQRFRKLSHFPDKEGKTRTIAIFDYWSQTILKPLHEHLNSVLKGIYNDCTFNQDHFRTCLPSSGPYYSFDLTNATDRMPLLLQKAVLSYIIGDEKADAGARILCDGEFSTRGEPVRYNTGQPMGAYSSGPAMALTHHFIVRGAGLKAGKPHFNRYALLGDDIVIADHAVAVKYKEILSALAMPISANKTHVSDDTYEFAKRWIQKGVEVSPLSLAGISETGSRYGLGSSYINTQQQHGGLSKRGDPEKFLTDILEKMRRYRQIPAIIFRYQLFTLVLSFLRDRTEASADHISHLLALPFPEDYNKVSFLIDLIGRILGNQSKKEEKKLLESKADYHILIRDELKKLFPDLQALQLVRHLLAEHSPLLGAVGELQRKNTDTLITLYTGTDEEKLECILSKDIVGTSIRKEVFSVRNAKSRVFSQSLLVTHLKREWQDYLKCDNFL